MRVPPVIEYNLLLHCLHPSILPLSFTTEHDPPPCLSEQSPSTDAPTSIYTMFTLRAESPIRCVAWEASGPYLWPTAREIFRVPLEMRCWAE